MTQLSEQPVLRPTVSEGPLAPRTFQDAVRPQRSRLRQFVARFSRNVFAVIGLFIVIVFVLVGLFAPQLAPYDYNDQDLNNAEATPSLEHPLGTDRLGRDQLSRMIYATRTALFVAPTSVIVGLALGIFLGSLAGFLGGWVDALIMRISDVLFAFPGTLFAIFLAATLEPRFIAWLLTIPATREFARSGYAEFLVVILALSVVGWPGLARLVRGQILTLKEQPFVESAVCIGASPWWILTRHLLPNAMPPVIVAVSMGLGGAVLAESTLSFFGIGIQPPIPSFGQMVINSFQDGFWRTNAAPWLVWAPGLVVASLVFAFNFIGDGLNEALNPRDT